MLLAFTPDGGAPEIPTDPLSKAANAIIQTGVLGALLILAMGFAVYAVIRWNRANEARVADQKEMSATLTELTVGFKGALADLNGTTNALREAMASSTTALREAVAANTTAVATVQVALSTVVTEAVRAGSYRRMSPPGGAPVGKPPGG